jgi:hypothetical protein
LANPIETRWAVTTRACLAALFVTAASLVSSRPAEAQRSGFIIGFGLGPGVVSAKSTIEELGIETRDSRAGLAWTFHIGGVIGSGVELYALSNAVIHASEGQGEDYAFTGLSGGVGVTYPLSSRLFIKGAVGIARRMLYFSGGSSLGAWEGLGLQGGARLALNDRWAIDLDLLTAGWNSGGSPSEEGRVWGLGATLNVLSH